MVFFHLFVLEKQKGKKIDNMERLKRRKIYFLK
jgi:hypothetical protein